MSYQFPSADLGIFFQSGTHCLLDARHWAQGLLKEMISFSIEGPRRVMRSRCVLSQAQQAVSLQKAPPAAWPAVQCLMEREVRVMAPVHMPISLTSTMSCCSQHPSLLINPSSQSYSHIHSKARTPHSTHTFSLSLFSLSLSRSKQWFQMSQSITIQVVFVLTFL